MIKKADHIAIAVKSLEEARKKFEELYGAKFVAEKTNQEENYKVAIFRVGESIFSMLESTSPEGFVAKHIEHYGESIQHVGVEVDNIKNFVEHLLSKGVKTSGYKEIEGVRKEVLVGARNAFGIILQVLEWIGNYKEALPEERMTKVWS